MVQLRDMQGFWAGRFGVWVSGCLEDRRGGLAEWIFVRREERL